MQEPLDSFGYVGGCHCITRDPGDLYVAHTVASQSYVAHLILDLKLELSVTAAVDCLSVGTICKRTIWHRYLAQVTFLSMCHFMNHHGVLYYACTIQSGSAQQVWCCTCGRNSKMWTYLNIPYTAGSQVMQAIKS